MTSHNDSEKRTEVLAANAVITDGLLEEEASFVGGRRSGVRTLRADCDGGGRGILHYSRRRRRRRRSKHTGVLKQHAEEPHR